MPDLTSPVTGSASALAFVLKRAGGVIESEIRGQSMGMTLPAGTRIRIRCGTDPDYPDGTVIAFAGARGLVGHRVVGRLRDRRQGGILLLTRGDGMLVCDPPLASDRVLGQVAEYYDGRTWQALPGPPPAGPARRAASLSILSLVHATAVMSPRLGVRLAQLFLAISQRAAALAATRA